MGIQYVARKPLKVDGRTIEPGEIVPEAATWKNVKAYVNDGSLALAVEVPEGAVEHADLKAQVAALETRVGRLESLVAGAGETEGDIEVADGDIEVADGDQQLVTGSLDAEELRTWSRDLLNEVATGQGIANPAGFESVDDLIGEMVTIPVEAPGTDSEEQGSASNESATVEPIDLDNLKGISREELDARAVALGIEDAPKLGSKGAVAAAINEKLAESRAEEQQA